ncbi:hypothetical protein MHYP_G00359170 [Metynnis hypsauchen]
MYVRKYMLVRRVSGRSVGASVYVCKPHISLGRAALIDNPVTRARREESSKLESKCQQNNQNSLKGLSRVYQGA